MNRPKKYKSTQPEDRLRTILQFDADNAMIFDNIEIYDQVIKRFYDYWIEMDETHQTNYVEIINTLYRSGVVTMYQVSKKTGVNVRTLARYRIKFVDKMSEIIEIFKRELFKKKPEKEKEGDKDKDKDKKDKDGDAEKK